MTSQEDYQTGRQPRKRTNLQEDDLILKVYELTGRQKSKVKTEKIFIPKTIKSLTKIYIHKTNKKQKLINNEI